MMKKTRSYRLRIQRPSWMHCWHHLGAVAVQKCSEEDLIDQLFNSSEKRLARLLLLLANFGKDGKTEPVIGRFSQETLAEMIGTTRSRVSFFMNKFRTLGYIDYNGKLEIHNSLLNVVLYDKPEIKTKGTGGGTK
jgi:hypothetical protein